MRNLIFFCFVLISCKPDDEPISKIELEGVSVGTFGLSLSNPANNVGVPVDKPITIRFNKPVLVSTINAISIVADATVPILTNTSADLKSVIVTPSAPLGNNVQYVITISSGLQGKAGEEFSERTVFFTTKQAELDILSFKIGGQEVDVDLKPSNVALDAAIEITFSAPLKSETVSGANVGLTGSQVSGLNLSISNSNKTITISGTSNLAGLQRYQLNLSTSIKGANDQNFAGLNFTFYTVLDPTPKFPLISDEELLTKVQQQTFKYFWDFAHPASGMARERNTSGDLVTSGGSGFGLMSIIVGVERGFISRSQGIERLDKILDFLETADRFNGAWAHWMNGNTGDVIAFSANDNGGDLVETSFLVQGLITVRQYLNAGNPTESQLIDRINLLYQGVEWDWYRRGDQNVMYWHWSPDKGWAMNLQVRGWNEALMVYLLAAASPTHSIPKVVYDNGWANNGNIRNGNAYEGITLPLGYPYGGPLFLSQYSFLGLNPNGLSDAYCADYFNQNKNHSLINYKYCIRNPRNFVGYSSSNWGLTASDNHQGYNAHSPTNDLGVITPTAALSAFPYTPDESMQALKFFYYTLGDKLWGQYGFYDAFNITENWYASSYLAIDQGPIIIMIENHRTGLLWDLFMSAPEVQSGLTKLGFTY